MLENTLSVDPECNHQVDLAGSGTVSLPAHGEDYVMQLPAVTLMAPLTATCRPSLTGRFLDQQTTSQRCTQGEYLLDKVHSVKTTSAFYFSEGEKTLTKLRMVLGDT